VVGADERWLAGPGVMLAVVSEDEIGAAANSSFIEQYAEVAIERQLA